MVTSVKNERYCDHRVKKVRASTTTEAEEKATMAMTEECPR
jgi:hypothetical protein